MGNRLCLSAIVYRPCLTKLRDHFGELARSFLLWQVADVVEDEEARVRDQLMQRLAVPQRRIRVVRAPDEQRRLLN